MFYLAKMAFRNIRRNSRRSFLAVTSVTLSIMLIVSMQGMTGGLLGSMVKNATRNETGHVRITTKKFQDKYRFRPVTENIHAPQAIISIIKNDPLLAPHVTTIAQRITFGVLLSHKGNNKTAQALAGEPAVEKDLLLLSRSILPGGRYIRSERETIIGARLAQSLGYAVGDTMIVVCQGSDYALHLRKFSIVGIFKTGVKTMDDAVFQIPLADAQQLLRTGNTVQQIILMIDNYQNAETLAAALETRLADPELAITPWTKIGDVGNYIKMVSSIFIFMYWGIALLGAFIIGNIMMMIVLERRREIGILKAMGMERREVTVLFLTEGMVLGLIGSVTGIALGIALSAFFHLKGLDLTKMLGSINMPIDNVIYFTISPSGIIQALVIGTVVSAFVSILPSRQASRMNAVEAIKSV
jgi:putative ABC transport system permease protein